MKKKYNLLTLAPFAYSCPSLETSTKIACILFSVQIIMLLLAKAYLSVMQIVVTIIASIVAELIYSFLKKSKINISITNIFQGFLIGMFIPEGYSIVLLFLITVLSLLISSYAFGGFAQSWANPVIVTVIFLYLLGTRFFPDFIVNAQYLQNPNVTQQLINDGLIPKLTYDSNITNFLNGKLFKYVGVALPEGYISLFWDTGSVIPAFRFNTITLVSTIILLSYGCINWIIPLVYLVVYGALVRIFGLFPYGEIINQGDILLALFSSGTIITAFFLLQWPGTNPLTIVGKIIYGIIAAVAAFCIIGCGTSPIGSMFVVLIANICSPIIQFIEDKIYIQILKIKGKSYDR